MRLWVPTIGLMDKTFAEVLAGLSITPTICLDAGDILSYAGSGQTWDDTSGNANDFFFGADVNAAGDDPTFTGSAGGLSSGEYMSFDGGDFFNLEAANNPAGVETMHKNNAQWWCFGVFYYPSSAAVNYLFSTGNNLNTDIGIGIGVRGDSGDILQCGVGNGVALAALHSSTATMTESAWNTFGISVDEAGGATASIMHINGTNETFDGTITLPSSSSATYKMAIGCRLNAASPNNFIVNTGRLACFAIGTGAVLTATQLTNIRTAIGKRFGL